MTEENDLKRKLFDGAVALSLVGLNLLLLIPLGRNDRFGLVCVLVVVHAASLFWRRRAPLVVLGVALGTGGAVVALGYPSVVLGPTILVAIYSVAAETERRSAIPVVLAAVAATSLVQVALPNGGDYGTVVGNAITLAVSWFLGDTIRQRREYVRRLEERTVELEQARDELARSAVVEERLRIARELHDIIGHTVGSIAVQAGVGAHVAEAHPEQAKRSLEAIESVSKSALAEIRQVLGALREEGEDPDTRPAPRLDELHRLVGELPEGVAVDLDVDEDAFSLAPGLQLTIYRVVQEALTNVIRHSGARRARVTVRSTPAEVRVEVVDDGAGSTSTEDGHGLRGMKERVAMHGGRLEAGALQDEGFRVSATFPTGERR